MRRNRLGIRIFSFASFEHPARTDWIEVANIAGVDPDENSNVHGCSKRDGRDLHPAQLTGLAI